MTGTQELTTCKLADREEASSFMSNAPSWPKPASAPAASTANPAQEVASGKSRILVVGSQFSGLCDDREAMGRKDGLAADGVTF